MNEINEIEEKKSKKRKSHEMNMCEGPVLNKVLLFAIPLMCSSILQLLFNAADIVVVGKFAGDNSLAAVGATSSLINLLTNLFIGLSIGANILAAKEYGAKKNDELSKTVHTSIALAIISGILLMIIGIVGASGILKLMNTPAKVENLAALYLRIYFIGMPATMIYNFGSALLRAIGDTKRPLYYLLSAGVVNVVLNLFFVIVLDMDVAGVAIATVISQCISAGLVIRCLMKETGAIKLYLKKLKVYKDKFFTIVKIGLPAGFQGMLFSLSNVVIQSSINGFGEIAVAGNSAAGNIEGFVYMAMNAFYQAAISFTSQNMGAGRVDRIKKILLSTQASVIVVGIVFGNFVYIFAKPLLGLYSSNPDVIEAGTGRMAIICSMYALCGMMDVMVGMLRGLGYSIIPMIVALVGACGLRIVWIMTVFKIPQFHKIETVYWSYPITWTITLVAHVICFILVFKHVKKKYRANN